MTETVDDILIEDGTELIPYEESDDPNKKAHVVRSGDNPHIGAPDWSAKDVIEAARVLGVEIVALCGYKWVPKHNPDAHSACSICLDLWSKRGSS